ncbi:MAG: cell division protein FtsL [Lachnospiraceae bacterium]|nr:cell division protein FtsL [Lachnospiraceae bacterium]
MARYIEGNTARQLDVRTAIHEEPRKRISAATKQNREKAIAMNLGYLLFLSVAMIVAGLILVNYIRLQSDITTSMENVSYLESEYSHLKEKNEETYNRIISNVNLEEVQRVATEELGMTYATEEQVITYHNENSDYVRQYSSIPE